MNQIRAHASISAKNFTDETKNFLDFFLLGGDGLNKLPLKNRFKERMSQIVIHLSFAKISLGEGRDNVAKTSVMKAKARLIFFCELILEIPEIDIELFIDEYMEGTTKDEDTINQMKVMIRKTLNAIQNDSEFVELIAKFKILVEGLITSIESIDAFFAKKAEMGL